MLALDTWYIRPVCGALIHSRPRVQPGWLPFLVVEVMDQQQFRILMDEIKQSREEVKELKREVNTIHERTTRELFQKILKSTYQFKKKVHEIQFNFSLEIEESITLAKKSLRSSRLSTKRIRK